MMLTSGDVQAVVWIVLGVGGTLWAALMTGSLLFAERARRAQHALTHSTARTLWRGVFGVGVAGIIGIILVNQPNGLFQFIGYLVALGLIGIALIGSCGIAGIAADRIMGSDRRISRFGAVGRAAGLMAAAGMMPIFGWFLVFPLSFVASVGAGIQAVFRPAPAVVPAPSAPANIEGI